MLLVVINNEKDLILLIHANINIQLLSRICHLLNFNHSVWAHRTISLLVLPTLTFSPTNSNKTCIYNSPQHQPQNSTFEYFKQAEIISPINKQTTHTYTQTPLYSIYRHLKTVQLSSKVMHLISTFENAASHLVYSAVQLSLTNVVKVTGH